MKCGEKSGAWQEERKYDVSWILGDPGRKIQGFRDTIENA